MIEIYTDGSFHPQYKKAGVGYMIKQNDKTYAGQGLSSGNNPTDVEIDAIDQALRFLLTLDLHDNQLVLYTDCKFAIHAINRALTKQEKTVHKLWKRVQRRTGAMCRFMHVTGHKGNVYNEWCDKTAKEIMWREVNLIEV
jgi:ribonuclease HI